MASSRTLKLKILGDIDGLTKSLRGGQGGFKQFAKVAGLAIAGAAAAFGKMAIAAGEAASTANARIAQINESMGLFGAETQRVTDSLIEYAEATARATGMDTNSIKLTQAKLLTFKELAATADTAGGSFERATNAAIDMAAAGFGSAETNAVQLGKALNDPIKGITALTRSGITFTESEKQLIATMVESGDIMGAQEMILGAIETQVGGTAEATANASDKMNVAFQQLTAEAGEALLPAFEDFTTFVIESFIPAIESTAEWIAKNKDALALLAGGIAAVTLVLKAQAIQTAIVSGITKAQIALQAAWNAVMSANPIGLIVAALALLAAGFVYAWNNSETFRNIIVETAKFGIRGFGDLTKAIGWMAEGIMRLVTFPLRKLLEGLALLGNQDAQNALNSINGAIEGTAAFFDEVGEKIKASAASLDKYKDYQISFFGDTSEAATDAKDVTAGAYEATAAAATASGAAQEKAAAGVSKAIKKTADDVQKANDRMEASWLAAKASAKAVAAALTAQGQKLTSYISDLHNARKAYGSDIAADIFDQFNLNAAAADAGEETGKSYIQAMLDTLNKGKDFSKNIIKLAKSGLSLDVLKQIAGMGSMAGGALAAELVASPEQIAMLNATQKQFNDFAAEAGKVIADLEYAPVLKAANEDWADFKFGLDLGGVSKVIDGQLVPMTPEEAAAYYAEAWAATSDEFKAMNPQYTPDNGTSFGDLWWEGMQPPDYIGSGSQNVQNNYITVNGALDPEAVARQINGILQTSANRTGNYTNLGVGSLSLAGV